MGLALSLAASVEAPAAETDPYYAWSHPPGDSTDALNAHVNERLTDALLEVNRSCRWDKMTCAEVAEAMVQPLRPTTMWFFVGGMDNYHLDAVPRSNTEYLDEYVRRGIYRDGNWWKWGFIVPPDPTIHAAGVNFSPDKIGHFFFEGQQYYRAFRAALADGFSPSEAHEEAIWLGIEDESWIQGDVISGIFSYADLEANEQGLLFYRSLCDGESPLLQRGTRGWYLTRALDFRDYVNPCWDEAWYVSAFEEHVGGGVRRAMREYCPIRNRPEVVALLRRYRTRGCTSFSYHYLEKLAAMGVIPDRRPYTIEAVCSEDGAQVSEEVAVGSALPKGRAPGSGLR